MVMFFMKRFRNIPGLRWREVSLFAVVLLAATSLLPRCGEKKDKAAIIPPEKVGNLTFLREPSEALTKAKKENRPLFIDFYADWCVNCKLFSDLAQKDEKLNAALAKAVLLKVYDTDPAFADYRKKTNYSELNEGLPLFVILNPDGSFRWKGVHYKETETIIRELGR